MDSVGFDFGDSGSDLDAATLTVFSGLDGTGTELGVTTVNIGSGGFPDFGSIALARTGILSFTITAPLQSFPYSLYYDNFSATAAVVTSVPEPGSVALLGLGLAALAAMRVRRKA